MANTIQSPNMLLPVPTVGTDPGPDWANNLNACLTQIDAHNHTSNQGVQIPPGGLNINADLTFQGNNATNLRSTRFTIQGSPLSTSSSSDVGCVYVSGVDLYYNDVSGNQVRITSGGGVAGSPGSITNLNAPASAAYVSGNQTFVWQSASNTPANMDFASAKLRNLTAGSKALTLSPPNAMASDYSIVLPSLPATTNFMVMDNAGTITVPIAFANGITSANIANGTLTTTQISASAGIIGTQLANNTVSTGQLTASVWSTEVQQEGGADGRVAVSPGVQQYHPSAAKVWCEANYSGTAVASYNISSITDNGAGDITFNFSTNFTSGNYSIVATGVWGGNGIGDTGIAQTVNTQASSVRVVNIRLSDGSRQDGVTMMMAAYGDQ